MVRQLKHSGSFNYPQVGARMLETLWRLTCTGMLCTGLRRLVVDHKVVSKIPENQDIARHKCQTTQP